VSAWTRVHGPDHPIALRSRSSLANCYHAAGRYDEAILLFEAVLHDRERVLGPDHPDTLRNRGSLANCYQATGR
jgi:hypothetical protein